jgi:hypothetical protein
MEELQYQQRVVNHRERKERLQRIAKLIIERRLKNFNKDLFIEIGTTFIVLIDWGDNTELLTLQLTNLPYEEAQKIKNNLSIKSELGKKVKGLRIGDYFEYDEKLRWGNTRDLHKIKGIIYNIEPKTYNIEIKNKRLEKTIIKNSG